MTKNSPFRPIFLLILEALGGCANTPASHAPYVVDGAPTAEASSRADAPTADAPVASNSGRPLGQSTASGELLELPGRALVESAQAQAQTLANAIAIWQANQGVDVCPRHEDLVRDDAVSPDSDGLDPWGHPFSIMCSDTGVTVTSSGPDEKPGTPDDVGNH